MRRSAPTSASRCSRAYVGERTNRRHKPGRAFERTDYRFDVLADYGAFRDLQRHRMLTIEWQPLSPRHGYEVPDAVAEAGLDDAVRRRDGALGRAATTRWRSTVPRAGVVRGVARVPVRFVMQMNAREAMHLLELRTSPQGHPAYRQVAQEMHRLIAEQAGHRAIAAAMSYVDHDDVRARTARRRARRGGPRAAQRDASRDRSLAGELTAGKFSQPL